MMRQVIPQGALVGFIGVLGLLGSVQYAVGLSAAAWVVGLASGVLLSLLLARGLLGRGQPWLGPADRVTLTRGVLACGIAALTADSFGRHTSVALLVGLSTVALALDVVDGWVARRTGTSSALGARFDMETDAFLILVLSIHVSQEFGWWVLAGGAARYALIAATWRAPWLAAPLPARRWRKLVAGLQGIVLTAAASDVLAPAVATVALTAALGLLALSFGTQVRTLWRIRLAATDAHVEHAGWSVATPLEPARVRGAQWQA